MGWRLEVTGKWGWLNFKKGDIGNIGGLHKKGGLGPLCQLWEV